MNYRRYLSFALLGFAIGCAPTTPTTSTDFTNGAIEYRGNVSGLYGISTTGTPAVDLQWKDASGRVTALSNHIGKPILVTFWMMSEGSSDTTVATLDSVSREMGDSVFIVAVAEDNTPHSFMTAWVYDSIHNIGIQLISDSSKRAHIQYAQLDATGSLGHPITFLLNRQGHNTGEPLHGYPPGGVVPRFYWEDKIRQLYK